VKGDPTTIDAQLAAVQREIEMREQVYPRRVADGKMNKHHAEWQMQAMRAVLRTLKDVAMNGPVRVNRK
jgi:hypothetical protein